VNPKGAHAPRAGTSVIVTTFNRRDSAARLVSQLLRQRDAPGPMEILVVNDHGDPSVFADVRALPNARGVPIRFFDTGYDGYGPVLARNAGLRFARHATCIFCDDDIEVGEDYVASYQRAPDGPRMGRIDSLELRGTELFTVPDSRGALAAGDARLVREHEGCLGFIWSANFAIPTQLARVLGGFDEAFLGEKEEDLDFSARAVTAFRGLVTVPGARALHHGELGSHSKPLPGRAREIWETRRALVVNQGMAYWKLPKWEEMIVRDP
jgi:GT2 family glycosyltransferase